jgi:DHA3 family macrolide efflux protein-like MFS transporter
MDEYIGTLPQDSGDDAGWKKKTALFLSSQSLSLFGSMLVQYAIIWYITLTTQSGAILTISTLCAFLPQIVISLFAGVWADRYPRKILIVFADVLTAASTLILAVFFLLGYGELWLIFLISAIRSVGAGIQTPAVSALLPQIVPTDKLIKVNSINGTIQPFIMIAAPVVSGALLSFSRLEAIFFIDVVTAMIAVSLLLLLKVQAHQKAAAVQSTGYFDDLKAGLTYIGRTPVIKALFIFFAFVFFLAAPVAFLTPLLVTRSFGEEVWRLTANEVTFFVGSIIGGIIMTAWGGFKNRFRTIGLACILWGILFAGLGFSKDFILYLVIMFLSGIPMPLFSVPTTTLLQEIVEPDMQGRVFGVQQLIMNTVLPVGMVVFGPIADIITVEALLILASILMILPGLWLFFNRQLKVTGPDLASSEYEMEPGD